MACRWAAFHSLSSGQKFIFLRANVRKETEESAAGKETIWTFAIWGRRQLLRHAVRPRSWGHFPQNSSKCKDLLESILSSNVTEIKWNESKCLQPECCPTEREQQPLMCEVSRIVGDVACPAAAEGLLCALNSHQPHIWWRLLIRALQPHHSVETLV